MGLEIKVPKYKIGEKVLGGTYDSKLNKIVYNKKYTIKKIHHGSTLLSSDYFEFKEIPGMHITHRFKKIK